MDVGIFLIHRISKYITILRDSNPVW